MTKAHSSSDPFWISHEKAEEWQSTKQNIVLCDHQRNLKILKLL